MKIKKCVPPKNVKTGEQFIVTEETVFVKDKPKIFEADGILSVYLHWDKGTGRFIAPSSIFNSPSVGDLVDVELKSRMKMRCVVTKSTQDYVSCTGELHMITYKHVYDEYVRELEVK